MRPKKRVERAIQQKLRFTADPAFRSQLLTDMMGAQNQSREAIPAPCRVGTRRMIMKNSIVKLGIAAAIMAVLGTGLVEFLGTGSTSGVVWAEVAEKVGASRGFVSRVRQTYTQTNAGKTSEHCLTVYNSPKHGLRMDSYEGDRLITSTYIDYAERTLVSLMHQSKQYTRQTVPAETVVAGRSIIDPKELIEQFLAGEYKKLGTKTIEGAEAEGIEVKDPAGFTGNFPVDSVVAQLWVNAKTGYPVKLESETIGNNGDLRVTTVSDRFQWNVEFDASQFHPVIPADYEQIETPQR